MAHLVRIRSILVVSVRLPSGWADRRGHPERIVCTESPIPDLDPVGQVEGACFPLVPVDGLEPNSGVVQSPLNKLDHVDVTE